MNMKKLLESIDEHMPMPSEPVDRGNPVSMNINLSATGKEHVADLVDMMKNAGLGDAEPVSAKTLTPRLDMERLRGIVDSPEMEAETCADCGKSPCCCDEETDEGYENEPDYEYSDHEKMTHDLSGGINREKKQYKAAQPGDNAMATESIKEKLYKALSEKKAKPDFLDMDKDGDKKEPMKKAVKDKKKKMDEGFVVVNSMKTKDGMVVVPKSKVFDTEQEAKDFQEKNKRVGGEVMSVAQAKKNIHPDHKNKLGESAGVCSDCGKPSYTTLPEEKQKGVDGKVCWKGYKRMGTKKKGGKTVDNCVKM